MPRDKERQHTKQPKQPKQTIYNADGTFYQGKHCNEQNCNQKGHEQKDCRKNRANWCRNQGCKSPSTHKSDDCFMITRKQVNSYGEKHKCGNCGMTNHKTQDCRKETRSDDVLMTSPTATSPPYCAYCNTTDHALVDCRYPANFVKFQGTKLKCSRCGLKGHTHDICQNPRGRRCAKCLVLGHDRDSCPWKNQKLPKTPTTPLRRIFDQFDRPAPPEKLSRFAHKENFQFQMHRTQEMRRELEFYIRDQEIRRDGYSDEQRLQIDMDIEQKTRELEYEERQIFQRSSASSQVTGHAVNITPRRLRNTAFVTPVTFTGPPARPMYSNSSSAPEISLRSLRRSSMKLLPRNLASNDAWTQQAIRNQLLREINQDVHKVLNKIAQSRAAYTLQIYNNIILRNEIQILEAGVVSRMRMNQIKGIMMQGAIIFRDPAAMAALFARKIPYCSTCHTRGAIVDEHFEVVTPNTPASELYLLEDTKHPGWGLFIVFQCEQRCSRTAGYVFLPVSPTELPGCDLENDPEYHPYSDI